MKVQAVLLAILVLLSGPGVLAGETAKQRNIALNKPVTASSYYRYDLKFAPYNAVDGDMATGFTSDPVVDASAAVWWQMDLGKQEFIHKIIIKPRKGKVDERRNFTVSVSNDPGFKASLQIGAQGAAPYSEEEGFVRLIRLAQPCRYIKISKTIPNEPLGFMEVEVFVSKENEDIVKADPDTVDPAWTNIALSKQTKASSSHASVSPANAVDGNTTSFWTISGALDAGRLGWWQVDLQTSTQIYGIEIVRRQDIPEERRYFQVLASNDPEFNDFDVLFEVGEQPYLVSIARRFTNQKKYRYVRIKKTKAEIFGFSEFRVFGTAPPPPPKLLAPPELLPVLRESLAPNESDKDRVIFDNQAVVFKGPLIERDNIFFVPAQEFAALFDADITLLGEDIVISKGALTILMTAGKNTAFVVRKQTPLEAPPFFEGETLYLPLRSTAENLGAVFKYEQQSKTIMINQIMFEKS